MHPLLAAAVLVAAAGCAARSRADIRVLLTRERPPAHGVLATVDTYAHTAGMSLQSPLARAREMAVDAAVEMGGDLAILTDEQEVVCRYAVREDAIRGDARVHLGCRRFRWTIAKTRGTEVAP